MKWTTKDKSGKKVTHYVPSGVAHNPPPRTKRGLRRQARKAGQQPKKA